MQNKKNKNRRRVLRELRKAKADLAALVAYKQECEAMLQEYLTEWSADIALILSILKDDVEKIDDEELEKSPVVPRLSDDEYQDKEKHLEEDDDILKKTNIPDWVKKAFRKIAMKTHPDKVKDSPDAERLAEIYSKANIAVREENFDLLLEICNSLSIECELEPELELELNVKRQNEIRERLKQIESSLSWIWGESYDIPDARKNILINILPHYGIKDISEERLCHILDRFASI